MRTKSQNPIVAWFTSNLFNLIILVGGMLLAWATLNARVNAIEAKVAEYPSQDWFELKFESIDNSIKELKDQIEFIQ